MSCVNIRYAFIYVCIAVHSVHFVLYCTRHPDISSIASYLNTSQFTLYCMPFIQFNLFHQQNDCINDTTLILDMSLCVNVPLKCCCMRLFAVVVSLHESIKLP